MAHEPTVRVIAGPLAGLIVRVIDDRGAYLVVTFDDREGRPVRRHITPDQLAR